MIKIILGLSMTAAMFALIIQPALAKWPPNASGSATTSTITFTYSPLGSIKCEKTTMTYQVDSTGTVLTQKEVTWKECKTSFGGTATVSYKNRVLKQPKKEGTLAGKALFTVTENSTFTGGGCVITVESGGNKELNSVVLEKSGSGVLAKVNVGGITAKAEKNAGETCLLGAKTTTAEEKIGSLFLEGLSLE